MAFEVGKVQFDRFERALDAAKEKYDCAWYENFAHKVKDFSFRASHVLLFALAITAFVCFGILMSAPFVISIGLPFFLLFFGCAGLVTSFFLFLASIISSKRSLYSMDPPVYKEKIEQHEKEILELEHPLKLKKAKENIRLATMYQGQDVPPEIARRLIATAWLTN